MLNQSEKEAILKAFEQSPPKIGLVGVSGVGKSSTINTLFKTNLPISHMVACTKKFLDIPLSVRARQGVAQGQTLRLIVFDDPGLGEDIKEDPTYIDMYHNNLPLCDAILWVMSARNRAVALDQMYLKHFTHLHDRILFGVNQVDLIDPMNWPKGLPIPSKEQETNIFDIVADRKKKAI
jgi:predicted GTPase